MRSALTRSIRVLADTLGSSTSGRGAAAAVKAVPPSRFSAQSLRASRGVSRAIAAVLEPLEERTLMSTTYYVSNAGNDSNKGTISSPWKTPGKVSSTHLNPGDQVLFEGGETFSGSMNLYNDGGSATNPVVIGSYGSGKATIASGTASGAWSLNSTGISFENLTFLGTRGSTSSQDGIRIENYTSNTTRSGFTVNNCNISGYAEGGIVFGGDSSNEFLNDVTITNNTIDNNVMAGIESYSVTIPNNTNVYIANNQIYNNYGDGVSRCTGSGIELGGVNGAVVERNIVHDNGEKGGNGDVGIWAYSSNNVVFQYNESYNNATTRGEDGDGFDFDADVTNSVIQYNYAFNNDGTGIQLDQWKTDGGFKNNIVRYNVLQDNARLNNYGNLEAWGDLINCYYYNNVIYTTPGISGSNSAIRVHNSTIPGLYVNGVHFVNNIIETTNGAVTINIPYGESEGAKNLTFTGNVYYASGQPLKIHDGNSTYTTLASWQGAGQEKLNGKAVGLFVNPELAGAGTSGAITNISALYSLSAYQLTSGSPVLSQGINVAAMYGLSTVSTDFFGHAVPASQIAVPGADQVVAGAVVKSGSSTTGSTGSTSGTGSSTSGSTTTGSTGATTNSSSGSTSTGSTGSTGSTSTGSTSSNTSSGSNTSTGSTSSNTSSGTTTLKLTGATVGTAKGAKSSGSGSSYSVTGAGTDIWGTSDNMQYEYMSLTGNGTMIAEVASQQDPSSYSKAGIMIRNGSTISSNAAEVSMLLEPDAKAEFQTRATAGAVTSTKEVTKVTYKWVKLVRNGSTFSGYISSNGTSWTLVGTSTVSMTSTVTIGLAVTAHDPTRTNTASFTNVSIVS